METKISFIDENNMDREALSQAGDIIRAGGLVAFPTETVYGLGGNALDASACSKIYEAKGRPSDNPLIVHVASPKEITRYAYEDPRGLLWRLADMFMPGPLTVVLKKKDLIPDTTTGGLDTVAIRCPANAIAREFISACGVPIAAPSANRSGSPSPTKAEHVKKDMDGRIPMILSGEKAAIGLESTIVSLVDDCVKLLRPGFITLEDLEQVCGSVEVCKAVTHQLRPEEVPLAPGMKYRHYAPDTELVMVKGAEESVLNFFSQALEKGKGLICFEEDCLVLNKEQFQHQILSLGEKENSVQQAALLFDVLRQVDALGVSKVFVRAPSQEGVGLAVYNRLIKACAYQMITLS